MNIFPFKPQQILDAMKRKGYAIFTAEFDLNLVGIRAKDLLSNGFNDWFTVWHTRRDGTLAFYAFQCTTDPGVFWRRSPENAKGTAIVKAGQYRGLWTFGKHHGEYDALVQVGDITVWRDANKDDKPDIGGPTETGKFGINCHRAKDESNSISVDKWSAGCQVFADDDDFEFLLTLCGRQKDAGRGNKFSYTLLDEADIV